MSETDKEKLNRIGNIIYLVIVGTLAAIGIAVIVFAAVNTL